MIKFPFSRLQVKGASMLPTFSPKQYLICFNWAYWFKKPTKGEIVVIKNSNRFLVKRIKDVRAEKLFLMGDNPKQSTDSRQFGWISKDKIVGRVVYVFDGRSWNREDGS